MEVEEVEVAAVEEVEVAVVEEVEGAVAARHLHVRQQGGRVDEDHLLDGRLDVDPRQQLVDALANKLGVGVRGEWWAARAREAARVASTHLGVGAALDDQVEAEQALLPQPVLLEQVGDQQQQPAVVLDPPHVDVPLLRAVGLEREVFHVVVQQHGLVAHRRLLHHRQELGDVRLRVRAPPPRPAHQDRVRRERAEAGALDRVALAVVGVGARHRHREAVHRHLLHPRVHRRALALRLLHRLDLVAARLALHDRRRDHEPRAVAQLVRHREHEVVGVAGDERALRARRRRAAALLLVGLLGVVDELLAQLVQQQQLRLPVGVEVLGEVDRQQLADRELEAEAVERLERRRWRCERSGGGVEVR